MLETKLCYCNEEAAMFSSFLWVSSFYVFSERPISGVNSTTSDERQKQNHAIKVVYIVDGLFHLISSDFLVILMDALYGPIFIGFL